MIKPRALKPGATIGLVSPSGAFHDQDTLPALVRALEGRGFRVVCGESCTAKYGYLAGPDAMRAGDVMKMFLDEGIDAVFCARGGYGAARIVPMLDYQAIKAHAKPFVGYSDVTALHAALNGHAELITFHGPMFDLKNADADAAFSADALFNMLAGDTQIKNPAGYPTRALSEGTAVGRLAGGNLTVLVHALGTPYEPEFDKCVLFLEDIGEKTYRIDEMLTNLRNAGVFDRCAGIVFGDFKDCPIEYEDFGLSLEQIISDIVLPSGKPVLWGLRAGHCSPKLTLPLGALVQLDAAAGTLRLLEDAVLKE